MSFVELIDVPDVFSYAGANILLDAIETGDCSGPCKTEWIRYYKRELKKKKKPYSLKWTVSQKKNTTKRIETILKQSKSKSKTKSKTKSKSKTNSTTKKYRKNPFPPYPASLYCGQEMSGNDGKLYIASKKNGVCSWKKKYWWWW